MNTPTPPTLEAVEAALKAQRYDRSEWGMEPDRYGEWVEEHMHAILAAEVQRLRAECEKLKHERNRAGMDARREMMVTMRKQIKPGPDKPKQEPDLYCGACGQPSAQSLWFSGSHTAVCPLCAAEFVCGAGR